VLVHQKTGVYEKVDDLDAALRSSTPSLGMAGAGGRHNPPDVEAFPNTELNHREFAFFPEML
jgi:hypothetical protein